MSDVEAAFHQTMQDTYHEAVRSINYRPTYFMRVVNEMGGVATAHKLLEGDDVSEEFTTLWERGIPSHRPNILSKRDMQV